MSRPHKKHHKIPATYLQAFSQQEKLWVADENFKLYQQTPQGILSEKDFYTIKYPDGGGTLAVEKKVLGKIETSYSHVFRTKLSKKEQLSASERYILAVFISSMFERVSARRDATRQFLDDVERKAKAMSNLTDEQKKAWAAMPSSQSGEGIPVSELLKIKDDMATFHSSSLPRNVLHITNALLKMHWVFMIAAGKDSFYITSDNPCVWTCPETLRMYCGLVAGDIEITLPLSPVLCVMCGWRFDYDGVYVPVPEKYVQEINRRTMRQSRSLVSSNKDYLAKQIERIKARLEQS
jgi:hypothetical protein